MTEFWFILGNAIFIFALRLVDVSMGTVRTILITRDMRKLAAIISFVEVTIWVIAISRIIGQLENVWNILGFSGGFAAGTLLGMWFESKLAFGCADVQIISLQLGTELCTRIRGEGYGATQVEAQGRSGPVQSISVVTPRKKVKELLGLINEIDPSSFVNMRESRHVERGYLQNIK